jgi:coatomer protein complex subunit gamma
MYVRVLDDKELADVFVREEATFSLASLETELASYVNDDSRHSTAFDLASVPKVSREQAAAEVASSRPSALESINASSSKIAEPASAPATALETQQSNMSSKTISFSNSTSRIQSPIPFSKSFQSSWVLNLIVD